jgi:hypothetical protein
VKSNGAKRKDVIQALHTELKSTNSGISFRNNPSVPLSIYQNASSKGQDPIHGGDSSKVLVQWLNNRRNYSVKELSVLEVGCLEVDNAIGKYVASSKGKIRRIDLKSRDPQIEEQDFMTLEVDKVGVPCVKRNSRNST